MLAGTFTVTGHTDTSHQTQRISLILLLVIAIHCLTACQRQDVWPFTLVTQVAQTPINETQPLAFNISTSDDHFQLLRIDPVDAEITVEISQNHQRLYFSHLPFFRQVPTFILLEPDDGADDYAVNITAANATPYASVSWSIAQAPIASVSADQIKALRLARSWLDNRNNQHQSAANALNHALPLFNRIRSGQTLVDEWLLFYHAFSRYNYEYDWCAPARIFNSTFAGIDELSANSAELSRLSGQFQLLKAMGQIEQESNDTPLLNRARHMQASRIFSNLEQDTGEWLTAYEQGQIANLRGLSLTNQKRHDEAIAQLLSAQQYVEQTDDRFLNILVTHNLAFNYAEQRKYDKAADIFSQLIDDLRNSKYQRELASTHYELGRVKLNIGDFIGAAKDITVSLEINERIGETDAIPRAYLQLSRMYFSLGDPIKARHYIDEAISGIKDTNNGAGLQPALELKAKILAAIGDQESLSIIDQVIELSTDDADYLRANVIKAEIYLTQQHYEQALTLLNNLTERIKANTDAPASSIARLATIYAANMLGRTNEVSSSVDNVNGLLNLLEKKAAPDEVLKYIYYASEIFSRQNLHVKKSELLHKAVSQYYKLQTQVIWPEMRPEFAHRNEALVDSFITDIYRTDPDKALNYYLIFDHLSSTSKANLSANQTDGKERQDALSKLAINPYNNISISEALESTDITAMINTDLSEAVNHYNLSPLSENTTALIYHLGEAESHLWIYRQNQIESFRLADEITINSAALELSAEYQSVNPAHLDRNIDIVSSHIIPQNTDLTSQILWVVYDGHLKFIPFGLIKNRNGDSIQSKYDFYMVSDLTRVSERYNNGDYHRNTSTALLAGDPIHYDSNGNAISALPQAAAELRAIKATLGAEKTDSRIKADFTRENILNSDLTAYQAMVFATHAYVASKNPNLSYILTSSLPENDNPDTNKITTFDILNMNIDSPLVLLSACKTSFSNDRSDDSHLTITDAFLNAGALAVVGTVKDIDDSDAPDITKTIVTDFLQDLFNPKYKPNKSLTGGRASYQIYL
ncbi:MAG: hypothetical protein Tsb002_25360 [Wenzhouxiangellaceae bacterium]